MAPRPIRAVLFDFGNTLFAHAPLAATIVAVGAQLGRTIDPATAGALAARIDTRAADPEEIGLGRDLDALVWSARWSALYASGDDDHPGLGAAIDASMHDPLQWVPYAATAAVLDGLHRTGVRIGVVSNTGWDVRGPFTVRGLDTAVDAFTLSYEAGAAKPEPQIFTNACAALGVDPGETLMVGDDPRADVGGIVLGIRTVLLAPTAPGSDNGLAGVIGFVASSAAGGVAPSAPTGAATA